MKRPVPGRCRCAAAVFVLCAAGAGCTTWQPVPIAPADAARIEGSVRLTLRAGPTVLLGRARLVDDSIVGVRDEPRSPELHRREERIALADVTLAETQQFSAGATAGGALFVIGTPILLVLWVASGW